MAIKTQEGTSIKAPVQLGLDKFFARFEAIRAEEEKRADLEMQRKIEAGTATFEDQVDYLKTRQKLYSKGSSGWEELQLEMENTERLAEETYLQNAYKMHQINPEQLLGFRIGQREKMEDGSKEALALEMEIWNIQKLIADIADETDWRGQLNDYITQVSSEKDHLKFMQDRLNRIPMWDKEKRWTIEQQISEQIRRLDDMREQESDIEWESKWKNKLVTEEKYLSWLKTDRMDMVDNDVERAQVQGQIESQEYRMKQIQLEKENFQHEIWHTRRRDNRGKAYTEQDYHKHLLNMSKKQVDPIEKQKWLLKAAEQQQVIYQDNFERDLGNLENKAARSGWTDKQLANQLTNLRNKYNKPQYNPDFVETLSKKITQANVSWKQESFKHKMQMIEDKFGTHKSPKKYRNQMKALKKEFNQPIFQIVVNRQLALQANDLKGVTLANKMHSLTKAFNQDKLDISTFLNEIKKLRRRYGEKSYQMQLDEFDYNLRSDAGNKAYDKWANPIKRKVHDTLYEQQGNDSYMRSLLQSNQITQGEFDDYKRKSDDFKNTLDDWRQGGKWYDYDGAGGYGNWAPENKGRRPGDVGIGTPISPIGPTQTQGGGGGSGSPYSGYDTFYQPTGPTQPTQPTWTPWQSPSAPYAGGYNPYIPFAGAGGYSRAGGGYGQSGYFERYGF